MTICQFQTHVSNNGVITLPAEFHDHNVVVSVDRDFDKVNGKFPIMKKRKANADEVKKIMDTCYGCLEGLSDGEFEQLKMEKLEPEKDGGAFRISDLRGIGAEIWQDENVNEYIQKERNSWD